MIADIVIALIALAAVPRLALIFLGVFVLLAIGVAALLAKD
jgi:hypothetical protein